MIEVNILNKIFNGTGTRYSYLSSEVVFDAQHIGATRSSLIHPSLARVVGLFNTLVQESGYARLP